MWVVFAGLRVGFAGLRVGFAGLFEMWHLSGVGRCGRCVGRFLVLFLG